MILPRSVEVRSKQKACQLGGRNDTLPARKSLFTDPSKPQSVLGAILSIGSQSAGAQDSGTCVGT